MTSSERAARPLRRRIAAGIFGIAALAVALFAIPLAVTAARLQHDQELASLHRDATRIAALVPDDSIVPGRGLTATGDGSEVVAFYAPDGRRVGGQGPPASALARAAADGRAHDGVEAGQLVAVAPVPSDQKVVAVVRTAVPTTEVRSRAYGQWALMGGLGLIVLAVAALLARRQSRRIAAPLERLTTAARALGDGDFTVTVERSGIREADAAGIALRDTGDRLGRVLQRERTFSADASHQLRTPLTGLLLGVESALARPDADLRTALTDALTRGRQLQQTIDDLLALHRGAEVTGAVDVPAALSAAAERWRPQYASRGRSLRTSVPDVLPAAAASAAALRQVLDVLLDNALTHGAGTVTLVGTNLAGAIAVEVGDEGPGLTGDPEAAFVRRSAAAGAGAGGHGIGLALARTLAEADGGRLMVRRPGPGPVFALLLSCAGDVVATAKAQSAVAGSNS